MPSLHWVNYVFGLRYLPGGNVVSKTLLSTAMLACKLACKLALAEVLEYNRVRTASTPIFGGHANMSRGEKLPVMYWIYGGGFVNGECSWSSFNGTELVKISGGRVIVVTINYRLNAFGFLSPAQVKAGGNLNVGSLDQRAGLQWVRQHALQFGGDPSRVTAFGESAGAISIGYQMIANNGDQRLFHQAMLFSGSALTFRCASYLLYQPTHDAITNITGCASSPDSLQCLRQVNATTLLAVASKVYNSAVSNFYPVVDGTFISETCSALLTSDRFSKIPIIIGTNTNEGTKFVTQYNFTNSEQLASGLIEEDMPGLTNSSLQTILELYPEQSNPPGAPYPEFARAANIIGDYMFICPAYTTAHDYQQFVPVYKYRFNVVADPTLGAFHTADLPFDFDQNALENFTRPVATLADTISSYYTSFAATGNPNTFRHPGSIEWPVYSQATGYQQIVY
ncbi:hypothetical protein BZG36_02312 [Bifiguratus adelaidae]|uniref:Carboxylesterase type B domain-containing protein n=1 Tax=Bifiguratus adelaidae TaxID=1938954 RepID=A0A261Y3Q1_9FUNG|nr:hypothetical protein BZG36_02312 [Bifiguratus adelaidae]